MVSVGSSLDLLSRYAWYIGNAQDRTWPVGQQKPNDLGLFDMHGNVWTWCQDSTPTERVDYMIRVLRGGSFRYHPSSVRAAYREDLRPAYRRTSVGFRVARSCD